MQETMEQTSSTTEAVDVGAPEDCPLRAQRLVVRILRVPFWFIAMLLPDRCYRFRFVRWSLGGSWVYIPLANDTDNLRTVEAFRHRCPWIYRARGWMQINEDDQSWLSIMVKERFG